MRYDTTKAIRFLGGTYAGVVLIALVAAYLGAASVLIQVAPDLVRRVLGVTGARVYSHPLLLALFGALCVNLAVATFFRIPLDLPRLGAWCSHAGVLVLLAGATWYALAAEKGQCITGLVDSAALSRQATRLGERTESAFGDSPGRSDMTWSPIDRFYLQDTFAIYARSESEGVDGGERWEPLGDLRDVSQKDLDTTLRMTGPVTIRAVKFLAQAELSERWSDDSPAPAPAVEVRLVDRQGAGQAVICPSVESCQSLEGQGYIVLYHPQATAEIARKIMENPMPRLDSSVSVVMILRGKDLSPRALALRGDGKRYAGDLKPHQPLEIELPGQTISLDVVRFLDHAQRTLVAPSPAGRRETSGPVLEVELSRGSWRCRTWLPFAAYPEAAVWQTLTAPGGTVQLAFSRQCRPLGGTLQIVSTDYQVWPGTSVPRDFRCETDMDNSGRHSRATISLNHPLDVGPYQLSQNSWSPNGADVRQIVLGVASRPGVWLVYLGMILISAGLPWAFYVKPFLLKRKGEV